MNALCTFLEDFGSRTPRAADAPVIDEGELESRRLAAFEEGYRAGWDDADKARQQDQGAVSEGLAQQLQDLSFTYHEAYSHIMAAVTPLLQEMAVALLPEMARATLGAHVAETLQGFAREIGATEVEIAVHPDSVDAVAPHVQGTFSFPLRLVPDAGLGADQAEIRFDQTEKQIDLGDMIRAVQEAVEGFAHDNQRTLAHG